MDRSAMEGVVCIIDGDEGVRTSLTALLQTLPVRVVAFSSGEEFLDHLVDGVPACLITELMLPGMTGFELLNNLQKAGISIPTVALAGEVDAEAAREAIDRGIGSVLEKPFVYWAVVQRVQEAMGISA